MANPKKVLSARNAKGMYSNLNNLFAALLNGDVQDLESAKLAVEVAKETNKMFENELKMAVLTGGVLRRLESTAFDDTTGQAAIMPIRKIG